MIHQNLLRFKPIWFKTTGSITFSCLATKLHEEKLVGRYIGLSHMVTEVGIKGLYLGIVKYTYIHIYITKETDYGSHVLHREETDISAYIHENEFGGSPYR